VNGPRHHYALYGATLRTNRPLPGTLPGRSGDVIEIDFAGPVEDVAGRQEPFSRIPGATLWHLDDTSWLLRYDHPPDPYCWTVTYTDRGARVTVRWSADWLLDGIPAVLQGPGVAAALHLRGVPILHAGAIAVDGAAILLMGTSGSGKSTTAAAFVRAGFPLVTDDVAALALDDGGIRVHAGYPRLRVYPDAARAAGWDSDRLPRVFVTESPGDKRYIEVSAEDGSFFAGSLPVRAIYLLAPRRAGRDRPTITPLSARAALPILMGNVYSARFLDAPRRASILRACARVSAVPVRVVQAPDDLIALPQLVEAIAGDAMTSVAAGG
jgi:hypothetical protein